MCLREKLSCPWQKMKSEVDTPPLPPDFFLQRSEQWVWTVEDGSHILKQIDKHVC